MSDDPSTLPQAGQPVDASSDERTMAALSHAAAGVFGLALIGILVPLIVYLAYQERSKYVRFHALQALVFQVVAAALVWAIGLVTCGFGLVLGLAPLVIQLYWAWMAYQGSWKPYPLLEKIGR